MQRPSRPILKRSALIVTSSSNGVKWRRISRRKSNGLQHSDRGRATLEVGESRLVEMRFQGSSSAAQIYNSRAPGPQGGAIP